jgi:hypothetical protein
MPVSPKARVVIVSGPAAVGKSTVSRLLTQSAANSACISGQALLDFVVHRENADPDRSLQYLSLAHLTDLHLEAGYELVVIDYQFDSTEHIWQFLDEYKGQAPVHLFTLWAPMQMCFERSGLADATQQQLTKFSEQWKAITQTGTTLGEALDARVGAQEVKSALIARMHVGGGQLLAPRWSSKERRPKHPLM